MVKRPTQTGSVVWCIGEGFHFNWLPRENQVLAEVNADHWITWLHERLSTAAGTEGAITLFHGQVQEHLALAKHLTAEVKTEEFVAGKGVVEKWERRRRQNHWFNALYNSCAAGYYCGIRFVEEKQKPSVKQVRQEPVQPIYDVERWNEMMTRYRNDRGNYF